MSAAYDRAIKAVVHGTLSISVPTFPKEELYAFAVGAKSFIFLNITTLAAVKPKYCVQCRNTTSGAEQCIQERFIQSA